MDQINENLIRAVVYIRVSDPQQVDGTSLEDQKERCIKYAIEKLNLRQEEIMVFRDEGETGKYTANREEFLRALEFCRRHKNQVLAFIVLRVNRFARNTEDHLAVRKLLLDYGTTLHSVTEPIGNKPHEKFVETVLAAAAEYDNQIRALGCTDGMSKRINQGIYPGSRQLAINAGISRKWV